MKIDKTSWCGNKRKRGSLEEMEEWSKKERKKKKKKSCNCDGKCKRSWNPKIKMEIEKWQNASEDTDKQSTGEYRP